MKFYRKELFTMNKVNPYAVLVVAVVGVSLSAIFVRFTQDCL